MDSGADETPEKKPEVVEPEEKGVADAGEARLTRAADVRAPPEDIRETTDPDMDHHRVTF